MNILRFHLPNSSPNSLNRFKSSFIVNDKSISTYMSTDIDSGGETVIFIVSFTPGRRVAVTKSGTTFDCIVMGISPLPKSSVSCVIGYKRKHYSTI